MFLPATVKGPGIAPWVQRPCGAITPKVGLALYLNAGALAIATGTTKPEYICMEEHEAAVAAGTPVYVLPVSPDIEFETQATAAMTAVKVGNKVTLATDGLGVTATTTDGVAQVVALEGTAVGDNVRVRFI